MKLEAGKLFASVEGKTVVIGHVEDHGAALILEWVSCNDTAVAEAICHAINFTAKAARGKYSD